MLQYKCIRVSVQVTDCKHARRISGNIAPAPLRELSERDRLRLNSKHHTFERFLVYERHPRLLSRDIALFGIFLVGIHRLVPITSSLARKGLATDEVRGTCAFGRVAECGVVSRELTIV